MLASRFLYESDMMWLNNKWLMIKMRHGDDSVMEVSRTWSVAPGAVHRIYLGRTVSAQVEVVKPNSATRRLIPIRQGGGMSPSFAVSVTLERLLPSIGDARTGS